MTEFAALRVNDLFLDCWQEYSFDSDIFTPSDAFRLSFGIGSSSSRELKANLDKLRANVFPGAVVKFYVAHGNNRALQGTGTIDAREIEGDGESTTFSCEGRDFAGYLVDSAAPKDLFKADASFVDVCRAATAPWGIKVTADLSADRKIYTGAKESYSNERVKQERAVALGIPSAKLSTSILNAIDAGTLDPTSLGGVSPTAVALNASRISPIQIYAMRIKDGMPQAGETVWEFLDRHAKRLGIMMRMGPNGTLTLGGLDYGQLPLYRLVRRVQQSTAGSSFASLALSSNNILSGGERYDASTMYKEVVVYGKSKKGDGVRGRVKGTATDTSDDALKYVKTLEIHDDSITSSEECEKRAYRELAKSRQGARVLHYTVKGHGQSGTIWATNTVASVEDDVTGINGSYYVVGRTFTRAKSGETRTQLKLVPLGSIALVST